MKTQLVLNIILRGSGSVRTTTRYGRFSSVTPISSKKVAPGFGNVTAAMYTTALIPPLRPRACLSATVWPSVAALPAMPPYYTVSHRRAYLP